MLHLDPRSIYSGDSLRKKVVCLALADVALQLNFLEEQLHGYTPPEFPLNFQDGSGPSNDIFGRSTRCLGYYKFEVPARSLLLILGIYSNCCFTTWDFRILCQSVFRKNTKHTHTYTHKLLSQRLQAVTPGTAARQKRSRLVSSDVAFALSLSGWPGLG